MFFKTNIHPRKLPVPLPLSFFQSKQIRNKQTKKLLRLIYKSIQEERMVCVNTAGGHKFSVYKEEPAITLSIIL